MPIPELFIKVGERYKTATPGQIMFCALRVMAEMGLEEEVFEIESAILNRVGFMPPKESAQRAEVKRDVVKETVETLNKRVLEEGL